MRKDCLKNCIYWGKGMNWCIKRTDPTIDHKVAAASCNYWEEKKEQK